MSSSRRGGVVVMVVVVVGVVIAVLAVVAVTLLPVALVLGAGVLALVAGVGSRVRRPGRRRAPSAGVPAGDGGGPDRRWTMRWELGVPVDAVPLVRERLAPHLREWGLTGEAAEPTLLVVTELVSNAAEHGRGPVRLEVERHGAAVHVAVHDGDPEPPRCPPADPARLRGRGLLLVEAVSSRWGWTEDAVGKAVWADVPTAWPS